MPNGAIAQLGERNAGSVEVDGSIPSGSTNFPLSHERFISSISSIGKGVARKRVKQHKVRI